MESFYGGRQGASFIIVKRFDGIDIPTNSAYKYVYYAVNSDGIRYYPFITRNSDNYMSYDWALTELDGSTVDVILEGGVSSTEVLDIVYQEGMRQCFEQGGDSVDIVNYGEYVIIDTVSKENPDNGKVYRRGMNFDYDPITNPLAGAEYIGQIVGPRGDTVDLDITTYLEVISEPLHQAREYTPDPLNGGLVPGANESETTFNDTIRYAWTTLKDEAGNTISYQVGFIFPYLVQHFVSRSRSPYYQIGEGGTPGTPLDPNFELTTRLDDDTHPFFKKWQINIPKGIKGDTLSNVQIYPTAVAEGSTAYGEVDAFGNLSDPQFVLDTDLPIEVDSYWDTYSKDYVTITQNDDTYYCRLQDAINLHYGYLFTWYDSHEDGRDHRWVDIGEYNTIDHIHLSNDGIITVYYTSGETEELSEAIKWIEDVSIQTNDPTDPASAEGSGDQKLRMTFNIEDPLNPGNPLVKVVNNPLNYVIENKISIPTEDYPGVPYGHLLVYYSDPALRNSLSSKWVTYPSDKYPGTVWTEWVDLGYVVGEPGGIHIIGNVTDEDDLYNDGSGHTNPKKPEDIGGDIRFAGWVMTVYDSTSVGTVPIIYAYDYNNSIWYQIGTIDSGVFDPKTIIDASAITAPPPSLQNHGFWLVVNSVKHV